MPTIETKFFEFRQNNSGGFFEGPVCVIIEARTADEADLIAEDNDIYFDGCDKGIDCSCCGDRWYPQWGEDGDEVPSNYGDPLTEAQIADTEYFKIVRYGE